MPRAKPSNVGIVHAELYTPRTYVDQADLEVFDKVSRGKYTKGLMQQQMAFATDLEDVHSICLTAVHRLMENAGVHPSQIGRLEVGTESRSDKSKSIKTVLMQLFGEHTDLVGADVTNACFGGTAAFLNAVNWIESSMWDGKYALVVCGDVAVYERGPARPTGGCGAVALLIGPDAPIVLEPGMVAHHMEHVYDFYKPKPTSEYPTVDGKLSVVCYLRALDTCYARLGAKIAARDGAPFTLDSSDYLLFHSPFLKLVRKSFGRLMFNDFLTAPTARAEYAALAPQFAHLKLEETYKNRKVERAFIKASEAAFQRQTVPSIECSAKIGNMYTASVWGSLVSLLARVQDGLVGKRVTMFSYGSGLTAAMFTLRVRSSVAHIARKGAVFARLAQRIRVPPAEYTRHLAHGHELYLRQNWAPSMGDVATLFPGTYYLVSVDKLGRRKFARKGATQGRRSRL